MGGGLKTGGGSSEVLPLQKGRYPYKKGEGGGGGGTTSFRVILLFLSLLCTHS